MCILATKSKKRYFTSLNKKYITENKCLWKTVRPLLSNKVRSFERIKHERGWCPTNKNEEEVAINLNDYFSNTVIHGKILKFENFDPLSENTDHPTLKAIVKYRKHLGIIAIFF